MELRLAVRNLAAANLIENCVVIDFQKLPGTKFTRGE